jgi:hypothetical protein
MKRKYTPTPKVVPPGQKGRPICPDKWIVGPDPVRREKYSAWLKHRAQARFRKEDYAITWPEWENLWSDDDFLRRGRQPTDLCLTRDDHKGAWDISNVRVAERSEHLKRAREYRNG